MSHEVSVGVINYGIGNLGSVLNMFKKIGVRAALVDGGTGIRSSSHLLLPGVGHFHSCMKAFNQSGLRSFVEEEVLEKKKPLLGICVGFQMLTQGSEEGGGLEGLGWFRGSTKLFSQENQVPMDGLKVPHMGWNFVRFNSTVSPLTRGLISGESRFYFVHSYFVQADHPEESLFRCHYGRDFDAGLVRGNLAGVQFHGEKSHRFGMQFFKNFSESTCFKNV